MMTRKEIENLSLEDLISLTAMLEGEYRVRLISKRAEDYTMEDKLREEIANSGDC